MRIKLGVLFLVAVIAIASVGMSYSLANDENNINGVRCPDVKFSSVDCGDNEFEKEVATVSAVIIGGNKGLDVDVFNGYPGYAAWVNFTAMNTGEVPIYVSGVSFEGDYAGALSLDLVPDLKGQWLYNCGDTLWGNLTVLVLDGAAQGTQYKFWVNLTFKD